MQPRMSKNEQELFQKYLRKATNYFEFGIGGSTVWANNEQNINKVTCVESDADWVSNVTPLICQKKTNINLVNFPVGPGGYLLNGYKKLKVSEDEKTLWVSYSTKINQTAQLYDLILVDGRFRVACACAAYLNLYDSGFLLIHDYASRKHYHVVEKFYSKVEEIEDLCAFQKNKTCNFLELTAMQSKYVYDFS
jgi:hypothetical protein